ncbi:MAG: MerR family transcriptional regulator [Myxococcales bacterium FL481]|nr:MAG: MerR family transcriptional regulator [Myxococcales bacterium FL481]
MDDKHYRVGELAQLAGVSVRTLHHYDKIGLLVPSGRTARNYRLYRDEDLLRLQQIFIGRELGMCLEDIRAMLDDPTVDQRQALVRQRERLRQRLSDTTRMIRAIDVALERLTPAKAITMNDPDTPFPKAIFDGFDPRRHQAEAERRWGETPAYEEATRRTRRYDTAQWTQIRDQQRTIVAGFAKLLADGIRPDAAAATDLAETYRLHIDRWFYPCTHDMHRNLAMLYTQDDRFSAHFDKHGDGVAAFIHAAIHHNAARA